MSRVSGLSRRELTALAAAFVLMLPAVTPRIYASDEIQYFSYLRSLWFDHDMSFENEYRHFYERNIGRGENFHATFLELATEAGRRPNFGTIGSALLWSPFYAVGDLVARLGGWQADGYSRPYVAAVAYGSAVYGFTAVVLGAAAARMLVSDRGASPRRPTPRARGAPGLLSGSLERVPSSRRTPHEGPGLSSLRHGADGASRPVAGDGESGSPGCDGTGSEVVAAVLVWLGTPLLFYMYVAPPYAHACSAFAVALFVFVWLRVRRAWSVRGAVALGLIGALMAMVREQDLFFALGPAVDFGITALRGNGRPLAPWLKVAVAGCLAFAAGYLPQLLAYWALNGYPGPSTLVVRKMSWHSPHALQVLGSPEHGFLLWTPLAIVGIAGVLLLAWRSAGDRRRVALCLVLMLALQVYVSGSVESWTVAGAFGQRRFVALTALLIIGVATVLRGVPPGVPRAVLAVAIALCLWWNVALAAAFGTGLMNRQRLELRQNAYDVFVTIPRSMPELAFRYLTNRESFYRRPDG
jgi:hypothetical protein